MYGSGLRWLVPGLVAACLLVRGAHAGSPPANCDGHGVDTDWNIEKGAPIQVSAWIQGQPLQAGSQADLGYKAVGSAIVFMVGAYDKDTHVCQIPQAPVKSYIAAGALNAGVYLRGSGGSADVPLATVALSTATGNQTDRLWNGSWTIPASIVPKGGGAAVDLRGKTLVLKLEGQVDDAPCSASKHAAGDDPAVDLASDGYTAKVVVPMVRFFDRNDVEVTAIDVVQNGGENVKVTVEPAGIPAVLQPASGVTVTGGVPGTVQIGVGSSGGSVAAKVGALTVNTLNVSAVEVDVDVILVP